MTYRIHDNGIDRDMTDEEIAAYEIGLAETAKNKAEAEAKKATRAAALAKLGLTPDEIAALFG